MSGVVVIPGRDPVRQEQLEHEARRLARDLARQGARRVIWFGSAARGQAGPMSDLDLLVVIDSEGRWPDRVDALVRAVRPRFSTDLFVYTPAELVTAADTAFIRQVVREGTVLHDG